MTSVHCKPRINYHSQLDSIQSFFLDCDVFWGWSCWQGRDKVSNFLLKRPSFRWFGAHRIQPLAASWRQTCPPAAPGLYGWLCYVYPYSFFIHAPYCRIILPLAVVAFQRKSIVDCYWEIPAAPFLGGQERYLNSYWRGAYKFYGSNREEEVPEYDGQIICDFDILPPDADLSRSAFDGISFLQILSNKAVHGSGKIELIYVLMLAPTEQDGVFQRVERAVIPSMHVPIDNLWVTRPIRII